MKTLTHFKNFVNERNSNNSRKFKQIVLEKFKDDDIVKTHLKPKSIRCIETGVVYPDMTTAAKALGMHGPSHISTACKTGKKAGGYHWEYAY